MTREGFKISIYLAHFLHYILWFISLFQHLFLNGRRYITAEMLLSLPFVFHWYIREGHGKSRTKWRKTKWKWYDLQKLNTGKQKGILCWHIDTATCTSFPLTFDITKDDSPLQCNAHHLLFILLFFEKINAIQFPEKYASSLKNFYKKWHFWKKGYPVCPV